MHNIRHFHVATLKWTDSYVFELCDRNNLSEELIRRFHSFHWASFFYILYLSILWLWYLNASGSILIHFYCIQFNPISDGYNPSMWPTKNPNILSSWIIHSMCDSLFLFHWLVYMLTIFPVQFCCSVGIFFYSLTFSLSFFWMALSLSD